MSKTIPCACTSAKRMRLDELTEFQGTLKSLSETDYAKLKQQMIEHGFCVPVFVWQDKILDGHQRLRVLRKEGWTVKGGIPVDEIQAKDEKDAARKLLAITSSYGKIEGAGLYEFMAQTELEIEDIDLGRWPDLNMDLWKAEFIDQGEVVQDPEAEWKGLPESENDNLGAYKSIIVRFVNEADYKQFAQLINRNLTPETKSIWHPKQVQDQFNKQYIAQ